MKVVRWILILVALLAAAAGVIWLAARQGVVIYREPGSEFETSIVVAALSLLVVTILLSLLWQLVTYLWTLPARIRKRNQEAALKKGVDALALGFAALEAGDLVEARKQAQKAAGLAPEVKLSKLLSARAAAASGDLPGAERAFGELMDAPGFSAAARRGLAEAALARGAEATALAHAEAALESSKGATWPAQFLFERKVAASDWTGAALALDTAEKRGLVGQKVAQRRRAVVLSAAAAAAERTGDLAAALDFAQRAAKLAPGFAPGAALAARLLAKANKAWAAASTLESAWEQAPHPALALAYRDLKAEETPAARARWMDGLAQMNPSHRESRILRAEQALALGDGAAAADILSALAQERLTSRLCTLLAAAARAQGDTLGARDWMAKAWSAAREPDWSDLDPQGEAFAYDDADWARLVESYGEGGTLIHPRHERFDAERLAAPEVALAVATAEAPAETPFLPADTDIERRPDDPGAPEPEDADAADPAREKPRFPFLR